MTSQMGASGYPMNFSKQVSVLGLRGRGAFTITRRLQKSACVEMGQVCRQARYLGFQLMANGSYMEDIKNRIRAANVVWQRHRGVWAERRLPRAVVRILFIGLVQGTLLSGLECHVLPASAYLLLERCIVGKVRYVGAFRRQGEFGGNAESSAAVMRRWKFAPRGTELLLRRLRMYVTWGKDPSWHKQVLTAIFGTLRLDRHAGVEHMGPARELVERSTPWADLMGKDFARLAELEGSPRCVADLAVNPLRYFLEGELRSEVEVLDLSEFRSREWTLNVAPPGYEDVCDMDSGLGAVEEDMLIFECPHPECLARFSSYMRLSTHYRFAHRKRHPVEGLVLTNQCPWCMSTFSSRSAATRHASNAVARGVCREQRSKWLYPVVPIAHNVCPICAYETDTLCLLQVHLRSHHEGPRYLEIRLDSSSSPERHGVAHPGSQQCGVVGARPGAEEAPARGGQGGKGRRRPEGEGGRQGGRAPPRRRQAGRQGGRRGHPADVAGDAEEQPPAKPAGPRAAGICFRTWMLPSNATIVGVAKEAGARYDSAVKEAGPGHRHGPPHAHVAAACIEDMMKFVAEDGAVRGEMSDVDAAHPPADKKRILEDMEAYLKLTLDELLRGILYWVVKENYAKDDGPRTARISYSLSGQQMAVSLGRDLEVVLLRMGATEKFGPPPRGALERVLEGHLRSVQGRRQ